MDIRISNHCWNDTVYVKTIEDAVGGLRSGLYFRLIWELHSLHLLMVTI